MMAARLSRQEAEQLGHRAETIALWYLRFKGYRLLARRFKSPVGEVDLVMRRGDTTAFIEVKARPTVNEAIEAVTPYQSKRIAAAAGFFMSRDDKAARGFCRFDIVAIPTTLWPTHIINAFDGR
jgi:putative endonuclease